MAGPDVPSPIDFHDPVQAAAWEADTLRRRPHRPAFFAAIAAAINATGAGPVSLLELGSGPGHLIDCRELTSSLRAKRSNPGVRKR